MSTRAYLTVHFLVLVLVIAVMAFGLWPRTDPEGARTALTQAGYSQIEITGWRFWGCGREDNVHTGFTAVGPTGVPVEGLVCKGWWKGNTIRLD
jgi:hypothetical protein